MSKDIQGLREQIRSNAMFLFPKVVDFFLSSMPPDQRQLSQQYLAACVFDIIVSHPFPGKYAARLICGTGSTYQVLARTTSENGNLEEALAALFDVVSEGLSSKMNGDDVHTSGNARRSNAFRTAKGDYDRTFI